MLPIDLEAIVYDHLCEDEGLVFIEDQVLGTDGLHEVLGRTELLSGRILVCAALKARDYRRFRFTVAHELGHWVLHRPLALVDREHPELFATNTIFVSTDSARGSAVHSITPAERQANLFASHLLIPGRYMRREYAARFGAAPSVRPGGCSLREHSRDTARARVAGLLSLADVFQASVEATAIALEQMSLVISEPVLL